jgi:hypothetical protein
MSATDTATQQSPAPKQSKPRNDPLYAREVNGVKRAVFLQEITNGTTQETNECFAVVLTTKAGSTRIGAIPTILPHPRAAKAADDKSEGYHLRNNMDGRDPHDPMLNFSDAADLAQGIEVVCPATGSNGDAYWQIISPGEPKRTEKGEKTFIDFGKPYLATAYLRPGREFDENGAPNVESFYIHSAEAAAPGAKTEHGKRDLKSWRQVPIEGSVNQRTGKNYWYTVTVKDALEARDAIAAGAKTFTAERADKVGNPIELSAVIGVPKRNSTTMDEAAADAAKPLKPMLLFTARAKGYVAVEPKQAAEQKKNVSDSGAALFDEAGAQPLPSQPTKTPGQTRGR